MGVATGFTAARMLQIEKTTVVSGLVDVNGNLILTTREGEALNAGKVKGDPGNPGGQGIPGPAGSDASIPAGTVNLYTGDVAPANWKICDGSLISRTTYASLFAIIGTKFGAGDGTTTFALPDLRGRVAVGKNAGDTDFSVIGKLGGAKTASHLHNLSDNGWARVIAGTNIQYNGTGTALNGIAINYKNLGGVAGDVWVADARSSGAVTMIASSISVNHGAILDGTTDSASVTTMQPWLTFNYIIKVTNGDTPGDSQLTDRVSALEAKGTTLTNTNWVNLAYLSGFTSGTAGQLRYCIREKVLYLQGGADGVFPAATYVQVNATTLPSGIVAALQASAAAGQISIRSGAMGSGMRPCGWEYRLSDGAILLGSNNPDAGTPAWIGFSTAIPLFI